MDIIPILVQHNGNWDSNNNYNDYHVEAILINSTSNFTDLVETIATQLQKDLALSNVEIKYALSHGFPPLKIANDMGVKVYIELKKHNPTITAYPLVVDFNVLSSSIVTPSLGIPRISSNNTQLIQIADTIEHDPVDIVPIHPDHINNNMIITDTSKQAIEVQQIYSDKQTLIKALRQHSVQENFEYRTKKSCKRRYIVVCINETCGWTLTARSIKRSSLFRITHFKDIHTCPIHERSCANTHATTLFVSSIIQQKIVDPRTVYTPTDIQRDVKNAYGINLTYMQAWRAKERAVEIVRGNPRDSYAQIPTYLYKLRYANPGTITKLQTEEDGSFLYLFIALNAPIQGWRYCKPTMVVDGTFLKAAYRGTMLTAATQDAQGQIIPIGYAIVDSENDASWQWFFRRLKEVYPEREGMCIVSDRHESIAKGAAVVYPTIPHCVCMYHLWNNVKGKFKKSAKHIKDLYFALSRAYSVHEFNTLMRQLDGIDHRVKPYLENVGYHKWTRSHCTANRTTAMTSNIVESVNAANKYARDLPVIDLLDFMTTMVQKWNYKNGTAAKYSNTTLTDKYEMLLNDTVKESQMMLVVPSTQYVYAVKDGNIKHIVCLQKKTCTCEKFQIDEFPCAHTMAVLIKYHLEKYTYCSPYYTRDFLIKTYEAPVHPLPDTSMCTIPDDVSSLMVHPPNVRIKAGRPRKKRCKGGSEYTATVTCKRCGGKGHNRRTCDRVPKN